MSSTPSGQYRPGKHESIGFIITRLHNILDAVNNLIELIESNPTQAAQSRFLWLNGDAGSGKTHLLCDVAKNRISTNLPTLIFMGQQIAKTPSIWAQLCSFVGISGEKDEFIKFITKSFSGSSKRVFLVIDAVNEGDGIDIWPKVLLSFLDELEKIPNLVVVLSCRSSYEGAVLGKSKAKKKFLKLLIMASVEISLKPLFGISSTTA